MIRRVTSALVVTTALAFLAGSSTLSATATAPASAAPPAPAAPVAPAAPAAPAAAERFGCSISLPGTVWVDRPRISIPASLEPDCALHETAYASWDVRHSRFGASNIFIFDGRRSAMNSFYDWEKFGIYYVTPRNSWNAFYDLTQNSRSYVAKSGSKAGISATRVRPTVTLNVTTTYYSPAVRSYRAWGNARVQLHYRSCKSCSWKFLKNVRTGPNGKATYRYNASHTRYYRAVSSATATVWGRASTTTVR
jgi:hypothetical protein